MQVCFGKKNISLSVTKGRVKDYIKGILDLIETIICHPGFCIFSDEMHHMEYSHLHIEQLDLPIPADNQKLLSQQCVFSKFHVQL